jgi:hypothetical protein
METPKKPPAGADLDKFLGYLHLLKGPYPQKLSQRMLYSFEH